MRRLSIWLLLASLPAGARGDDVFVAKPLVRMTRTADLAQQCSAAVKVEACTAFAGQVLTCACERSDDGWRISARAQFIPVMYLTGGAHVVHEQDHIADVRTAVLDYVGRLESFRFDSDIACEFTAANASARFPQVMDSFKQASNQRRHRQYRRAQ